MPITTVKKAKSTKTCRNCKGNVAGGASKCQNCGSTDLAKNYIVIRKSEATGEEAGLSDAELETASENVDDTDEGEDDIEDLNEEDFEPADDDEEDESDDEDEDDDGEEDEEDESEDESDEDEEEEPEVTKRVVRRSKVAKSAASDEIQVDIALAAVALIGDVSKALGDDDAYEDAMNDFNHVMDNIFEQGSDGKSISKEDKAAKLKRLKAELSRLKALKAKGGDEGDDEDVEKSDDLFAGLNAAQRAVIEKSQQLIEKNTNEQFETIAKSYGELPTSIPDLGAALRFLNENNSDAYTTITKALGGAAYAVEQSAIFNSFGSPLTGEADSGQTLEAITKSYQEADPKMSPEQALVKAMHDRPDLYQQSLRG